MTDEEFEARLENWGRWAFSGSGAKRRSMPLFCLIDRGEDHSQARDVAAVDVEDALRVQAAWNSLPFASQEEKGAKILLGLSYCDAAPRSALLKRIRKTYSIRIEARDADRLLAVAKCFVRNRLSIL